MCRVRRRRYHCDLVPSAGYYYIIVFAAVPGSSVAELDRWSAGTDDRTESNDWHWPLERRWPLLDQIQLCLRHRLTRWGLNRDVLWKLRLSEADYSRWVFWVRAVTLSDSDSVAAGPDSVRSVLPARAATFRLTRRNFHCHQYPRRRRPMSTEATSPGRPVMDQYVFRKLQRSFRSSASPLRPLSLWSP